MSLNRQPEIPAPLLAVLQEALDTWAEQFDGPEDEDLSISGADLVEWFAQWRLRLREQLANQPASA